MRKLLALSVLLVGVVFASGCRSVTVAPSFAAPGAPVTATATYELVGDITGEAEGTVILGLITLGVESNYCSLPGGGGLLSRPCPIESNALYRAFEKVKDSADALVCPVFTIEENDYIVFKTKKVTVRAKAVKYKANPVK